MTITASIVAFLLIWWAVFFTTLPMWVRRAGDEEKGHDAGAPTNPHLWRKALVTTAITMVLFGLLWWAVERDLLRQLFFGQN
ncbi:MAG: DUF1467 family protein [Rhodospirillaceae bacterium]|nr:DUF1467 family protein [Rhodospirillaceae bacterium]